VHLTTEDNRNVTHLHARDGRPVPLYTAEWNDDLHNAAHVLATGETDGYYAAFATIRPPTSPARWPRASRIRGRKRGEPSAHLPPAAFVDFLQNHDQTGNRALGRAARHADRRRDARRADGDPAPVAAHAAHVHGRGLGRDPALPLLRRVHGRAGEAVTAGRRREFADFPAFAGHTGDVPDPIDPATFAASRIDWARRESPAGRAAREKVRHLLDLRREWIVPRLARTGGHSGRVLLAEDGRIAVDWQLADLRLSLRANLTARPGPLPPGGAQESTAPAAPRPSPPIRSTAHEAPQRHVPPPVPGRRWTSTAPRRSCPTSTRSGVSHLYASPLFTATPGSAHGYDVTDPNEIDPALGGRAGLERLSAALKARGMGLVLDIVPNHMAFAPETPWLRDVLRHGAESRYARHFDLDIARERLRLPWLTDHFEDMAGEMTVGDDPDGPVLVAGDLRVPLAATPSLDAARAAPTPEAIRRLHAEQPWRLVHWRTEQDALTHRRFFNVTGLVGVRVEDPEVFEDTHALLFDLVDRGSSTRSASTTSTGSPTRRLPRAAPDAAPGDAALGREDPERRRAPARLAHRGDDGLRGLAPCRAAPARHGRPRGDRRRLPRGDGPRRAGGRGLRPRQAADPDGGSRGRTLGASRDAHGDRGGRPRRRRMGSRGAAPGHRGARRGLHALPDLHDRRRHRGHRPAGDRRGGGGGARRQSLARRDPLPRRGAPPSRPAPRRAQAPLPAGDRRGHRQGAGGHGLLPRGAAPVGQRGRRRARRRGPRAARVPCGDGRPGAGLAARDDAHLLPRHQAVRGRADAHRRDHPRAGRLPRVLPHGIGGPGEVGPNLRWYLAQTLLAMAGEADLADRLETHVEKALREAKRATFWSAPNAEVEDAARAFARTSPRSSTRCPTASRRCSPGRRR
jgi:hypothetical protein